jgi:hypothetical protein
MTLKDAPIRAPTRADPGGMRDAVVASRDIGPLAVRGAHPATWAMPGDGHDRRS